MLSIDKYSLPHNEKELLFLTENTDALYVHMSLLYGALDDLASNFDLAESTMQQDSTEQALFLHNYGKIAKQTHIVMHLFFECYEYLCLLQGEENRLTRNADETAECRQMLKRLHKEHAQNQVKQNTPVTAAIYLQNVPVVTTKRKTPPRKD